MKFTLFLILTISFTSLSSASVGEVENYKKMIRDLTDRVSRSDHRLIALEDKGNQLQLSHDPNDFHLKQHRVEILDFMMNDANPSHLADIQREISAIYQISFTLRIEISNKIETGHDESLVQFSSELYQFEEVSRNSLQSRLNEFREDLERCKVAMRIAAKASNEKDYVPVHGSGPYRNTAQANLAQKIAHTLSNATFGVIQSFFGFGHMIVLGVLRSKEDFKLETVADGTSEVTQIVVNTKTIFPSPAYSLGNFQVGTADQDHEAGHSIASAALGPLYLPTAALSYIIEGHSHSFLEEWADQEAQAPGFFNTRDAQVGLGSISLNGKATPVLVMKFKLEQRQIDSNMGIDSDRAFQWLNTKILAPILRNQGPEKMPILMEFDLLKNKLNLVSDNIDDYVAGKRSIRGIIESEQTFLHVANIPGLNELHVKALDWLLKFGFQYKVSENFKIIPRLGPGLALGLYSQPGTDYKGSFFKDRYDFAASFSLSAGVKFRLWNYITISADYSREWFSNKLFHEVWSLQVDNELRDPFKKIGFIQYLDFGASAKSEIWKQEGNGNRINQYTATLGLRF